MKRRIIYWAAGTVILLMLVRCHWVAPPLRRADAVIQIKTTGYCASMQCTGWKLNWLGLPVCASGPNKGKFKIIGQTAGGSMVRPGTVAVDPKIFPAGTKFYIPGYGWGIAEDVGGGIKGRHLDLYFRWNRSAARWGTQVKKVKVWYPRD
ncbi:MAG: 3D domain-containing protein [Kiritimatiellales bacterium]|nr:3D domain-containing protein [Kiritimatiellales bacterium]